MGMSSASIKVAVRCRPYTFEDKLGVHLVQQSEDKAAIKLVNYTGTSKRFASTWGWWSAYGWKRHQKGDEALAEEMSLVPQTSVYETAGIPIRTHVLNGSAVVRWIQFVVITVCQLFTLAQFCFGLCPWYFT